MRRFGCLVIVLCCCLLAFSLSGCETPTERVGGQGEQVQGSADTVTAGARTTAEGAGKTSDLADRNTREADGINRKVPPGDPLKPDTKQHAEHAKELEAAAAQTARDAALVEKATGPLNKRIAELLETVMAQAQELEKLKRSQTGFFGWLIAYGFLGVGAILFVVSAYCLFGLNSRWMAMLAGVAGLYCILRYCLETTEGLLHMGTKVVLWVVLAVLLALVIFLWKSLKGVCTAIYQAKQDGTLTVEKIVTIANANTPAFLGKLLGWWKVLIPNG